MGEAHISIISKTKTVFSRMNEGLAPKRKKEVASKQTKP